MTVEQVELRKILSQMLADEGINRETLKDMVNAVIEEKVEKAVRQVINESNVTGILNGKVDRISRRVIEDEVTNKVRRVLNCTSLSINCREPEPMLYWRLKKYEDTGLTPEEIVDGKMLTGWIPVEERLPEKYETVLVTAKLEVDTEWLVYEGALGADWELCGVKNSKDYRVVAWMPLPVSYVLQN